MGQIVKIGSEDGTYDYELPSLPKEDDILYYNLPKKLQYWRTEADALNQLNIKDVRKMSEKDRIEYIDMWRRRWVDGMWFMNNGEPTYITGMHMEHLCMNKVDSSYLYYLDAQRERFYFRDLTNFDRNCDGRIWIKARRTGITTEERTEVIRCMLSGFSFRVGMQSTKQEVCDRTLLKPIIDTYISRPAWMRETFNRGGNGRKPARILKLTDAKLNLDDESDDLGGYCLSFPTTPSGLDGDGWMLIIMDELSKWETAMPYETFEINKKAIINPKRRGKLDLLSTTGDSKEAGRAVVDWHKLIANSNPKIRNQNGKTNTGLYKFFVSGIHSLDLTEIKPEILDQYGFINKGMAEEYIWNEINQYTKDSKQYIFALYKSPMQESHALLSSTNANLFPRIRISKRLSVLREIPNDKKPYVRGNLTERTTGNGIIKVYFEAAEDGDWLVAVHPYFDAKRNIDCRNRFNVNSRNVYCPVNNPEFAIGYDPVRYDKETTKSNHLSRTSIIVHKKYDYFNKEGDDDYCADVKAALYIGRPERAETAHHEFCKAMKYWGAIGGFERQVETVARYVDEQNMTPMLAKDESGICGIWTNAKVIDAGVGMLVSRYANPQEEDQKDHVAIYPFEEGLVDLEGFDRANTTAFDITMSEIMLEHTLPLLTYTNVTDEQQAKLSEIMSELMPIRTKNSSFQ